MPVRRHPPHDSLLSVHVRGRAMVPVSAAAVGAVAGALGFERPDVARVEAATADLCAAVCEAAFDDPDAAEFDVEVESGPASLRLVVEDQGLPFTTIGVAAPGAPIWSEADAVRVHQHDMGHRIEVELRARSAAPMVGEATADAGRAPLEGEIEIRDLRPGDEESLARMIWRVYGYTYVADYLYHPDRVRRLRADGWLHAVVALVGAEVVGLDALVLAHPDDSVGDWTLAATDPRVRGRGVLHQVRERSMQEATELGLAAYFAEAVTEHTITQRSAVDQGAVETGVLFGFIPEGMRYKGFDDAGGSRQSAVLVFQVLAAAGSRSVYLPERYADEIRRIYRQGGLERPEAPGRAPAGETRLHLELEVARDLATIEVERCGEDAVDQIARHLRHALAQGAELAYCELSLSDPGTPATVEGLRSHGFFWAGMIPVLRGDVLRLQYLNFEPDTDIIELYTDEARRLLAFQLADRP